MLLWKKITDMFAGKNTATQEDNTKILPLDETKIFTPIKGNIKIKQAVPAILKVISGVDAGQETKLAGGRVNIGRIAGNGLELTDPGASRLHAFIVNEGGHHVVYDGKSMNGTYINGMRAAKHLLQHGDSVKIANTVMIYELE